MGGPPTARAGVNGGWTPGSSALAGSDSGGRERCRGATPSARSISSLRARVLAWKSANTEPKAGWCWLTALALADEEKPDLLIDMGP